VGAAFTERQDPLDVLVRIIHSESLKREDVQRGCPLLNLSQEMSGLDEGFRSRTAKVFKDWHDAVAKVRREGQKRGAVRNDINANETATFLIAAWEGYVVLGGEFAGSTDVAIRTKKRDWPLAVAAPGRCRP
jgi:TetR/AcrR family transcriptional repressor of nem operon